MPQKLTVACAQVHTQDTLQTTLALLKKHTLDAARNDVSILLFPEAFLGGYPRTCSFGAQIGKRAPEGYDQFHTYYKGAVDLGDTAVGEGDRWLRRELRVNEETGRRGDGTREVLEEVTRETGVFLVVGCVERAGGSLYCTVVFVDPAKGVVGKRRKVQPTGSERLVWSQGQPSSLKVVSAVIKGMRVVMGSAICWENFMPLLRYSLYAQGVNLYLAPTADPRPTWEPLMRTIAGEGRCWVVSCNQAIKTEDIPEWISGKKKDGKRPSVVNGFPTEEAAGGRRQSMSCRTEENHEIAWRGKSPDGKANGAAVAPAPAVSTEIAEWASRGGSCIVDPMGNTVVGPVWEKDDELLITEIDFDECEKAKFDFDATGHYARLDAFKLTVEGLDLSPPP